MYDIVIVVVVLTWILYLHKFQKIVFGCVLFTMFGCAVQCCWMVTFNVNFQWIYFNTCLHFFWLLLVLLPFFMYIVLHFVLFLFFNFFLFQNLLAVGNVDFLKISTKDETDILAIFLLCPTVFGKQNKKKIIIFVITARGSFMKLHNSKQQIEWRKMKKRVP